MNDEEQQKNYSCKKTFTIGTIYIFVFPWRAAFLSIWYRNRAAEFRNGKKTVCVVLSPKTFPLRHRVEMWMKSYSVLHVFRIQDRDTHTRDAVLQSLLCAALTLKTLLYTQSGELHLTEHILSVVAVAVASILEKSNFSKVHFCQTNETEKGKSKNNINYLERCTNAEIRMPISEMAYSEDKFHSAHIHIRWKMSNLRKRNKAIAEP